MALYWGLSSGFWLVADTWLAFFSVALLREELVPYFYITVLGLCTLI